MNTKRAIPWVALTLTVLLAGGTVAWGAPRDQWDYRRANRAGLRAVTYTGDKTTPDTLRLYMTLYVQRMRAGDADGLSDLSWHRQWFARSDEAAGAHQAIRTYGKGAAGAVSIEFTAEDPHDVRGGYIHYRRTEQTEPFTVFKRNGLWLFVIGSD
ncbi:hypothetical protein [Streptomyces sp. NBC_00358]|uniref:hypothetical protein n=1 Tax=Streptomyces sp. NBC_00358 TaxID=2975725 RepID=UPI002E25783C